MRETPRLPRRLWLTAGLPALALAACAAPSGSPGSDGADAGQGSASSGGSPSPAPRGSELSEPSVDERSSSSPGQVSIPAIDLAEDLIGLGLTGRGAMEVPQDADRLGWFTGGSLPGEAGPTVIAGHVDSEDGPAVFWRLPELAPGDRVDVQSTDGEIHGYRVDGASDHPKEEFPTAEVFGAGAQDVLRLITCTGPWMDTEESYRDNRVVFATGVDEAAGDG